MAILILKLVLTPLLIGLVSLAGRLGGPRLSGWMVALPLTSGPVAYLLALEHGNAFGARAAPGIIAGILSVIVFCVVWSWLAQHWRWPWALAGSGMCFAATTLALRTAAFPVLPLYAGTVVALLAVQPAMPKGSVGQAVTTSPWWDIPARMLLATAIVLAVTTASGHLGPYLSGLLTPFPVYTATVGIFIQQFNGPGAVAGFLRGVLTGLVAFVTFFLIVALRLEAWGLGWTFLAASAAALVIQAGLMALTAQWESRKPGF